MKKCNFTIKNEIVCLLDNICDRNNMNRNDVINKLILLWDETGDPSYYYDLTYDFKNEEIVEVENEKYHFKAELIKND